MSWLRYARLFMPIILYAVEVAERLSEDKVIRRRFMKTWMERVNELAVAALTELEDQIDDLEEDTSYLEKGQHETE